MGIDANSKNDPFLWIRKKTKHQTSYSFYVAVKPASFLVRKLHWFAVALL